MRCLSVGTVVPVGMLFITCRYIRIIWVEGFQSREIMKKIRSASRLANPFISKSWGWFGVVMLGSRLYV